MLDYTKMSDDGLNRLLMVNWGESYRSARKEVINRLRTLRAEVARLTDALTHEGEATAEANEERDRLRAEVGLFKSIIRDHHNGYNETAKANGWKTPDTELDALRELIVEGACLAKHELRAEVERLRAVVVNVGAVQPAASPSLEQRVEDDCDSLPARVRRLEEWIFPNGSVASLTGRVAAIEKRLAALESKEVQP